MKNYKDIHHQHQLNELRILRSGVALVFAARSRASGKQLERKTSNSISSFQKGRNKDSLEGKIDMILTGLEELSGAVFFTRKMLGEITGILLSTNLLTERSKKQLELLIKNSQKKSNNRLGTLRN